MEDAQRVDVLQRAAELLEPVAELRGRDQVHGAAGHPVARVVQLVLRAPDDSAQVASRRVLHHNADAQLGMLERGHVLNDVLVLGDPRQDGNLSLERAHLVRLGQVVQPDALSHDAVLGEPGLQEEDARGRAPARLAHQPVLAEREPCLRHSHSGDAVVGAKGSCGPGFKKRHARLGQLKEVEGGRLEEDVRPSSVSVLGPRLRRRRDVAFRPQHGLHLLRRRLL